MPEKPNHPHLDLEYAQINDNIRFLADVRFKLLGLLPVVDGAAEGSILLVQPLNRL